MLQRILLAIITVNTIGLSYLATGQDDKSRCPHNLNRNNHLRVYKEMCLQFMDTQMEWDNARDDCKKKGGDLVQVLDGDTQAFIVNTLHALNWDHNGVWIGATDIKEEGKWLWVTGQPVTYGRWQKGFGPQHTGFFSTKYTDDCAQIRLDHKGHWQDKPCSGGAAYHYTYICQYEKLTTTTTTLTPRPTATATARSTTKEATASTTTPTSASTTTQTTTSAITTPTKTSTTTQTTTMAPTTTANETSAAPEATKTITTVPTQPTTTPTAIPTTAQTSKKPTTAAITTQTTTSVSTTPTTSPMTTPSKTPSTTTSTTTSTIKATQVKATTTTPVPTTTQAPHTTSKPTTNIPDVTTSKSQTSNDVPIIPDITTSSRTDELPKTTENTKRSTDYTSNHVDVEWSSTTNKPQYHSASVSPDTASNVLENSTTVSGVLYTEKATKTLQIDNVTQQTKTKRTSTPPESTSPEKQEKTTSQLTFSYHNSQTTIIHNVPAHNTESTSGTRKSSAAPETTEQATPINVYDVSDCPLKLPRNEYIITYNDMCIRFVNSRLNWADAEKECEKERGHLVHISNKNMQAFVMKTLNKLNLGGNRGVWIGATDIKQEGVWLWTSGESLKYGNWDEGYGPEHTGFFSYKYVDDCAEIRQDNGGLWQDVYCTNENIFICQYDVIQRTTTKRTSTPPQSTSAENSKKLTSEVTFSYHNSKSTVLNNVHAHNTLSTKSTRKSSAAPETTQQTTPINVDDTPECPSTLPRDEYLFTYTDFCLRFMNVGLNWTNAEKECEKERGHLIHISDRNMQTFLMKTFSKFDWSGDGLWIGATDTKHEGVWLSTSGEPLKYGNWVKGSGPENTGFFSMSRYINNCAEIRRDNSGLWQDGYCSKKNSYICQYDKTRITTVPTTKETTVEDIKSSTQTVLEPTPSVTSDRTMENTNFNSDLSTSAQTQHVSTAPSSLGSKPSITPVSTIEKTNLFSSSQQPLFSATSTNPGSKPSYAVEITAVPTTPENSTRSTEEVSKSSPSVTSVSAMVKANFSSSSQQPRVSDAPSPWTKPSNTIRTSAVPVTIHNITISTEQVLESTPSITSDSSNLSSSTQQPGVSDTQTSPGPKPLNTVETTTAPTTPENTTRSTQEVSESSPSVTSVSTMVKSNFSSSSQQPRISDAPSPWTKPSNTVESTTVPTTPGNTTESTQEVSESSPSVTSVSTMVKSNFSSSSQQPRVSDAPSPWSNPSISPPASGSESTTTAESTINSLIVNTTTSSSGITENIVTQQLSSEAEKVSTVSAESTYQISNTRPTISFPSNVPTTVQSTSTLFSSRTKVTSTEYSKPSYSSSKQLPISTKATQLFTDKVSKPFTSKDLSTDLPTSSASMSSVHSSPKMTSGSFKHMDTTTESSHDVHSSTHQKLKPSTQGPTTLSFVHQETSIKEIAILPSETEGPSTKSTSGTIFTTRQRSTLKDHDVKTVTPSASTQTKVYTDLVSKTFTSRLSTSKDLSADKSTSSASKSDVYTSKKMATSPSKPLASTREPSHDVHSPTYHKSNPSPQKPTAHFFVPQEMSTQQFDIVSSETEGLTTNTVNDTIVTTQSPTGKMMSTKQDRAVKTTTPFVSFSTNSLKSSSHSQFNTNEIPTTSSTIHQSTNSLLVTNVTQTHSIQPIANKTIGSTTSGKRGTSNSQSKSDRDKDNENFTGILAGSVVGGLILLIIIFAVVCVIRRYLKKVSAEKDSETTTENDVYDFTFKHRASAPWANDGRSSKNYYSPL